MGLLSVSWFCKTRRSSTFRLRHDLPLPAFPSALRREFSLPLRLQFSSNSWKWSCSDCLNQKVWKFCRFHLLNPLDPFWRSWWLWIHYNWFLPWCLYPFMRRYPSHLVSWHPYQKLSWWPWVIWRRFHLNQCNKIPVFLLSKILKASLSYFMVSSSCYFVFVVFGFLALLPNLLIICPFKFRI